MSDNPVTIKKDGTITLQHSREQAKKLYANVHKAYYAFLREQEERQELPVKSGQELAEEIPFFEAMPVSQDIETLLKHDLFYLLVYGMNRKDMDNDWLFERCREVQETPDNRLDLWAREHYKSTIITIGLTIQNVLRNPDITVGIFSHTRPIAKAFLRQIKREWETNILLQTYFPFIAPPEKAKREHAHGAKTTGLLSDAAATRKKPPLKHGGLWTASPPENISPCLFMTTW